jgi:putative phosphoesterase
VRVAAISDIHANLRALEAVLADVERERVDSIVVVGDTVAGPWPVEAFDLVVGADASIVRGNADRAVLERDEQFGRNPPWCADQLGEARLVTVAAWPLTCELEIDGLGRVLVCHSTPTADDPIYTRITPDDVLVDLLGAVDADVLVCGHTHMQYDRTLTNGLRIVNPGSVGMPYEGKAGAYWAVLGDDVEFRRSEYDVQAAVAEIDASDAPVERFVEYLLEPRGPVATTEYFESLRVT